MTDHLLTAEMQEPTRGKVRTRWLTVRRIRYVAWRDGDDEDEIGTRKGFGDNEEEAIRDLLEKERNQ